MAKKVKKILVINGKTIIYDGSSERLKDVYIAIGPRITAVSNQYKISGYDAQDIKQEIYIKIHKSLPRYNKKKSSAKTFLYTVIDNHLNSLFTSQKSAKRLVNTNTADIITASKVAIEPQYNDMVRAIEHQIGKYDFKIFHLYYVEEYSLREMSKMYPKYKYPEQISRKINEIKEKIKYLNT